MTDLVAAVFAALETGDLEAARACFAPDAVVWHGFDQIERDVDATMRDWAGLIAGSAERGIADVHRVAESDALIVQQHLFFLRAPSGPRRAWPVCLVVRLRDGRIARLDEYIDRQGSFVGDEGTLVTPGLQQEQSR